MGKKTDVGSIKSSPNYNLTKHVGLLDDLPDELLIIVLSLLPTKDAVKASLLSRRWRDLWKHTYNVGIDYINHINPKHKKLIRKRWIEIDEAKMKQLQNCAPDMIKLLSSFQSLNISKFHVKLPSIRSITEAAIDSCVDFAFDHRIDDLALECIVLPCHQFLIYDDTFLLPRKIFQISSLVELKMVGIVWGIQLPPTMSLPLLRNLVLEKIHATAQEVEGLISNCPSLETLSIKSLPYSGDSISVRHENLKSLVLGLDYSFRLNTPALELLEIEHRDSCSMKDEYVIEQVSPQLKCHFILHEPSIFSTTHWTVLAAIKRARTLHFRTSRGRGSFALERYPSVTLECTCLILEVSLSEYQDLIAVGGLLAVSPRVQKLVFILKEYERHDIWEKGWEYFTRIFPVCMELKEVEIHGFIKPAVLRRCSVRMSCNRKVNVVKLLTKKSTNLEKITVHVDKYIKSAPMYVKDEFSRCLRRIQHCGKALFGPTSINLVYS